MSRGHYDRGSRSRNVLERWRAQLSRWKRKAPPEALNGRSCSSCLRSVSVEVPALRFNYVDVQVRNINVTCAQALRRQLARIGTAAGVCDLIAASMRQRESRVAGADGRQLG